MPREAALLRVNATDPAERIVVSCALSVQQEARLKDALRNQGAVVLNVGTFDQLATFLRSTIDPIDIVVLPFRDASGAEAPRVVREMVAERPRVAIVAYCRAGAQYSTDIRALAAAGVHQFVFAGIDDAGVAFRAVLDAARHQCAAEWVMCRLAPIVPATLHPMMEVALAKPETITTVAALASALGVVRGTVFNRCAHAWSVPPEEFLMWVRLALVAHFAETTGCTIETIAIQMAYPSVTALRNMMKRYTGLTTTEIRASGGLCSVVDALAGRLDVGTTRRRGLHLR